MSKRKVPPDEILIDLYINKHMSSIEIGKLYNMPHNNICKHLKRLEITRPVSGQNSRNRKINGEVIKTGYPVIHIPEHPRASVAGYVFKHIIVIEKKIGRIPNKSEPIHHIDLDRMNYSENNLYLCLNNSEHQKIHSSLNECISELIKLNIIKFNHETKKYYISKKVQK